MTQTAKHTPGPWTMKRLLPHLINIYGRDGNPIPGIGGVASCDAGSEAEANARIAVAGPELVELLTDIAAHLEGGAPLYSGSLIFREDAPALEVIRNAVAKATA